MFIAPHALYNSKPAQSSPRSLASAFASCSLPAAYFLSHGVTP
jgi:hypothetical protein